MDISSKIKRDTDSYTVRLYDYIPVNPALIDHVRKLDGFSVSILIFLMDQRMAIEALGR